MVYIELINTIIDIIYTKYFNKPVVVVNPVRANYKNLILFLRELELMNLNSNTTSIIGGREVNTMFATFIINDYFDVFQNLPLSHTHFFLIYEIYLNHFILTEDLSQVHYEDWFELYKRINRINSSYYLKYRYTLLCDLYKYNPSVFNNTYFQEHSIENITPLKADLYTEQRISWMLFYSGITLSSLIYIFCD